MTADAQLVNSHDKSAARQTLGLLGTGPVLLAVVTGPESRIAAWAAAILSLLDPQLKIVLAGDHRHRDRLIDWISQAGFRHIVVVPPAGATPADLARAADVMIATGGGTEERQAVTAAMLAGVPVVAAAGRTGDCLGGLVRHEVNGLLFDPKMPRDAARQIRRCLTDPALRSRGC